MPGASSSYHIKHFKLNILVRSCFYWLCLFFTTLTIQYGILKYSEFSLKWPYWPKSEVKHFTYLLTRINDEASICTAELLAIEAAIEYIWDSNDEEFMIITDSLSSLQALKSQKLNMCHYLSGHKDIVFCWVPSHIGIQGNERADVLAKAALDKTKQFYYIPCTDFKYNISVYLDDILQGEWNINVTSKLFEVQPIIKRSLHQWNAEEMTLSLPISQTTIY